MRVLILRADLTSANLGVRVLAEGTKVLAREAWGPATIVHFQNFDGGISGRGFNKRAVLEDLSRRQGPMRSLFADYDVVIDACGGDSFTDNYGFRRFLLIAYSHHAVRRAGASLVMGPQTYGPFSGFSRRLASRSIRRAAVVMARDTTSAVAAERLGRRPDTTTTDLVFLLPQPIKPIAHDVVVNVSGLLWRENPHVNAGQYREAVRRLIGNLRDQGREVTLLAHVLNNPRSDNDVPACQEVAEAAGGPLEVVVPKDLQSARQHIAGASVLIGSRMHACLNALSTGTPAIAWAYSNKFAPMLGDLGWDHVVDLRREPDAWISTFDLLADPEAMHRDLVKVARRAALLLEGARASLQAVGYP